jgi:hypothetical protein
MTRETKSVVERIASGGHACATGQFVETVAPGPDTWEMVPPDFQKVMIKII